MVTQSLATGAAVLVSRDGSSRFGSAGRIALGSTRPPLRVDHFRAGEITETFIAVVILQLAAEGRVGLDDPVERHLPGLIRGNGHDGRRMTLLHLLVHTAGLFPHLEDRNGPHHAFDRRYTPGQLVRLGLSHPSETPPGTSYRHAHVHYVVLGMVIEKLTGRSYASEAGHRILDPLHLTGTSFPGRRRELPSPHGAAYSGPEGALVDRTEIDPSGLGAGGELISTLDDLHRFLEALLSGHLLPRPQLARMLDTSDGMGHEGVGLFPYELSCTTLWGRRGRIAGSQVLTLATRNGAHALTVHANTDALLPTWTEDELLETEFCGRSDTVRPTGS
ncbi:serine hydrolase [Streptomyces sp. N35]|uniref:serine hydrolase domain-containing protein n=1 Tax=Streptomyces sp. N35 TaxID=2795730 RepID=UPI001F441681|nr:serine hydrolase domain-containing protein [Streptomyces sp. N35]